MTYELLMSARVKKNFGTFLFAQVLQVPVSYFYEANIEPDDLDHFLLSEFRKLPNLEAKQMILQMVRALSSTQTTLLRSLLRYFYKLLADITDEDDTFTHLAHW